jgi:hypothetical protein
MPRNNVREALRLGTKIYTKWMAWELNDRTRGKNEFINPSDMIVTKII